MIAKAIQNIVIVGGGTAGWMAANLFANQWAAQGAKISLIESTDIGTIGVGEGSTPYLKLFFQRLGIKEHEWMPACNATYKCGIRFPNWSTVKGYEEYVHPFFNSLDVTTGEAFFLNANSRRSGFDVAANPGDFFVAAELARQYRAPVFKDESLSNQQIDYGYHFDSGLLGNFLKQHAIKLGVHHVIGTISSVAQHDNGDINSVLLTTGEKIEGDFFVDCSGFSGLLINQTLHEPFLSYKNNLFNDRAIAIPTPLDDKQRIPSETISTALTNGWAWKIPLSSRFGNGYVYSSGFISDDDAETELRLVLGKSAENAAARRLKMRVGRVEQHWRNNCLAIGLSQGFIEPLEATALMLIQFTVVSFIEQLHKGDYTPKFQANFNKRINQFFEGVRDYIVAHYQLNSRDDSDYWRENRKHKNVSDVLADLLEAWDNNKNIDQVLNKYSEQLIYLRPSWYCILAGMGRFPSTQQNLLHKKNIDRLQAHSQLKIHAEKFHDHSLYLQNLYGGKYF